MPDGDIQLTVELNTSDVRTKAEQLRSSVSDLFKNVSGQELSSSLMNIMTQMDKTYTKSTELEAQLKKIDNANLSGLKQAYTETELELRKAYEILEQINQSANPEGYSQALETVQQWESALQQINADYAHIAQYGSGGMGYEQYETTAAKLNEVNNQMVVLQSRAEGASSKMGQIGTQASSSANQTESAFNRVGTSVSNVGTQASNSASQVQSSFNNMASAGQTADSSFSSIFDKLSGSITSSQAQVSKLTSMVGTSLRNAFNKVKSAATSAFSTSSIKSAITTLIKYTIGVRSLYFLFRKLRNAIKEGLENLVQFDSENNATNEAITSLNTSLLYLKNAWASAFSPIINYVMPVLTSLIDYLADVANAIARFIGNLTGQSVVLNAVKVQAEDYAESLSDTASSAGSASSATKKLTDRLAAFDDLNVLGKDDDTGSGGSGGSGTSYSPAISDMFEYVDATSDFAEMFKDAWENADFSEVGETIKNKLIEVLTIDWENDVFPYAIKIGSSLGSFLVGLLGDEELWKTAGGFVAGCFNTITEAFSAFLEQTEGLNWGSGLATALNTFLEEGEIYQAATNIHDALDQIITNIDNFINDISAEDVATAVKDALEGLQAQDLGFKIINLAIDVTQAVIKVGAQTLVKASDVVADAMTARVNASRTVTISGVEIEIEPTNTGNPLVDWLMSAEFDLGKWFALKVGASDLEGIQALDDLLHKLIDPLATINKGLEDFQMWLASLESSDAISWFSLLEPPVQTLANVISQLTGMDNSEVMEWATPISAVLKVFDMISESFKNIDTEEMNKTIDWWSGFISGFTDPLPNLYTALASLEEIDLGTVLVWTTPLATLIDLFTDANPEDIEKWSTPFGALAELINSIDFSNIDMDEVSKWWTPLNALITLLEDADLSDIVTWTTPLASLITLFTDSDPDELMKWSTPLSALWEGIKEAFKDTDLAAFIDEMFADVDWNASMLSIAQDCWDGFWNGLNNVITGIGDWVADNIITPFCEELGIASPSTVFEQIGIDTIQGLLNGINSLIEDVKQIFTDLTTNLSEKWDEIKSTAEESWTNLKGTITTKAGEIRTSVGEKITALKSSLSSSWENIKSDALDKFTEIKTKLVEIFTNLGNAVKPPINGFLTVVESMINKLLQGINSIVDAINGLPDITFTNPFTGTDYSLGFNVPRLSYVHIPRLAEGAVIPPNKEFMAVLGDQSHGTNIEAPLDTIKQAVAEELSSQIEVLQEGFNSVVQAINSKELAIGDKQIGQASARYNAQQARIRGVNW